MPKGLGTVDEFRYLKTQTDKPVKATCPGPVTLSIHIQTRPGDAYDNDRLALCWDLVPAVNAELKALLAQAVAHGTIEKGHERILTSAFGFAELKVRQIMTPRTNVEFLRLEQPIGEMLRTVQKAAYTRFPLVDGDIDHVVGLVHMKDLFNHLKLVPGRPGVSAISGVDRGSPAQRSPAIDTR